MPITITGVAVQGDILQIHYRDDTSDDIDERVAIIRWKRHPKMAKLIQEFEKIVGVYFLTSNKNLDRLDDADIEDLLRNLLRDDETGLGETEK